MNKAELAAVVARKTGMTKKDAEAATTAMFDGIVDALQAGDKVKIYGFGIFEVKERPEHKGHNPATGAEIIVPANKAAKFTMGKMVRDALN